MFPVNHRFPEEDTRGNVASDARFGHFVKEGADSAPEPGSNKRRCAAPTRLLLAKAQTLQQAEQIIRGKCPRVPRHIDTNSISRFTVSQVEAHLANRQPGQRQPAL